MRAIPWILFLLGMALMILSGFKSKRESRRISQAAKSREKSHEHGT